MCHIIMWRNQTDKSEIITGEGITEIRPSRVLLYLNNVIFIEHMLISHSLIATTGQDAC